jgi:hypothetical protein
MACPVMARCSAEKCHWWKYDRLGNCRNPASLGINMKARSLSVPHPGASGTIRSIMASA